jgi:hypothetical protein
VYDSKYMNIERKRKEEKRNKNKNSGNPLHKSLTPHMSSRAPCVCLYVIKIHKGEK